MSITVPAVGDQATAAWADAVANQLNTISLIDSGTWTVTPGAIQGTAARTFNISFNSAPVVVAVASGTNSGGQDYAVMINPATITTTGCTVVVRHLDGATTTGTCTIQWFAIGS